jgi:hypothetical protein
MQSHKYILSNGCDNTQLCQKSMGGGKIEGSEAMNMQQLHEGRNYGDGVIQWLQMAEES